MNAKKYKKVIMLLVLCLILSVMVPMRMMHADAEDDMPDDDLSGSAIAILPGETEKAAAPEETVAKAEESDTEAETPAPLETTAPEESEEPSEESEKPSEDLSGSATDAVNVTATPTPTPSQSPAPAQTEQPVSTPTPEVTASPAPTATPAPTANSAAADSSTARDIAYHQPALVNRPTGVTPGTCEIVCAAAGNENVQAKATVHVQRPVSRITFGDAPRVYLNETGKLQWTIEPADATHQELTFTSGNEAVLTVAEDGTVTGHSLGGAYITAIATDGSYRKAQQKVNVLQHLQSVKMARKTAYIDIGETAVAGAVLKPDKYINRSMTWETDDASVATVKAATGRTDRVKIHGVAKGTTTVTGTTEDGGLQASIKVKIGNYSRLAKIKDAYINGKGRIVLKVQGKPVKINEKNGSNKITAVYGRTLVPGAVTKADKWKFRDLNPEAVFHQMTVRITEYQINGDWVKTLRSHLRPVYKYKPKKKK